MTECSREEVEDALARVVLSPDFRKNRKTAQFLGFIVSETLEGRGARLKAYSIATLALDQRPEFDPQANSLVRVQATRLRGALQAYYAGPGVADPVRIRLAPGSYQPTFERQASPTVERTRPQHDAGANAVMRIAILIVGLIGVIAALGMAILATERPIDPRLRPFITVAIEANAAPALSSAGDYFVRSIETGLEAFDTLTLRQPNGQDPPVRSVGYALTVQSHAAGPGRGDFIFQLAHRGGEIVFTQHFTQVDIADSRALEDIARVVVAQVGDDYGAVATDFRKRAAGFQGPPRGHLCVLAAFDYLKARTVDKRRAATECLEADIAAEPDNALELALLSVIIVRRYLDMASDGSDGDLRRASQLARRAHDSEPQEARSHFALFLSRFYDKRFVDAFVAARRTMAINPNNQTMTAAIASAYISRGDYARGVALLTPLERLSSSAPNAFLAFMALAGFMLNDDARVASMVRRSSFDASALGLVMRAAALSRVRDFEGARKAREDLHSLYPGVAGNLTEMFDRYAFTDEIKTRLLQEAAPPRPGAGR